MSSDDPRETDVLRGHIIDAIRTVRDPEIPVNLYELGLIYDIRIDEQGGVHIDMTLTTPNCPVAELLPQQVETAVAAVDGVSGVSVDIVWEPEWTPDMMSEAAKLDLDFTGKFDPQKFQANTNLTIGRKPTRE
jgi:FeS assembly SUF system protein